MVCEKSLGCKFSWARYSMCRLGYNHSCCCVTLLTFPGRRQMLPQQRLPFQREREREKKIANLSKCKALSLGKIVASHAHCCSSASLRPRPTVPQDQAITRADHNPDRPARAIAVRRRPPPPLSVFVKDGISQDSLETTDWL